MQPQITPTLKEVFERQHYKLVGSHNAVKTCSWTKKMLRDEGSCYKQKFYGIKSNRCLQMTTSLACPNRCVFCWRDLKAPVSKEWEWKTDEPKEIIEGAIKAQRKLLEGFYGYDKVNKKLLDEAQDPSHVALSLTGEPIAYPRFNELIEEFHKRKMSTFVVTNGEYPEAIKQLKNCTQLYISIDASNKELYEKICKPLFKDYWERFLESLKEMSKKKFRKTLRITLIKDMNMTDLDSYKKLIELSDADFIEVKAYMWVGASRERLPREAMPSFEEVKEFSKELERILPNYGYIDEQKESWVVLLAKKEIKDKRFIDFEEIFK